MEVSLKIKALVEGFEAFKKARDDLAAVNVEAAKTPKANGTNDLAKSYTQLSADVQAAYKELRLVPDAEIKAKIDSIRAAYDLLAASGVATEAELERARASMETQIDTLEKYSQAAGDTGGKSIGQTITDGATAAIDGLTRAVQKSYDIVTNHGQALGASVVGVGLLVKRLGLQFAGGFLGMLEAPFAAAGASIAAVGVKWLTFLGQIYLVIAAFKILTSIVTGQAFKNDDIDALSKRVDAYEKLGIQLGLNATKAQVLAEAFERLKVAQAPVSQDSYTKAGNELQKLAKDKDKEGASLFKSIGVGSADQLSQKELIDQTAVALKNYTNEKDRQAAADRIGIVNATAYVAAVDAVNGELNASRAELQQYNLLLGQDGADALVAYEKQVAEFSRNGSLTLQGFKQVIVDALMPILTDLAEFFKDGLPGAVAVFRDLIKGVVETFHGLVFTTYLVTESILGTIKSVSQGVMGLARAIKLAMTGDFTGAWTALKDGGAKAVGELGNSLDNINQRVLDTNKKIRLISDGGGGGGEAKARPKAIDLTKEVTPKANTGAAGRSERDPEGARLAVLRAQLEAQIKLIKDALQREEKTLDYAYDQGLVSITDYYVRRRSITEIGIDQEIAIKQKEIEASKLVEAKEGLDEVKRLQVTAKRITTEADLVVLQRKRADVAVDTERAVKKATDEYAKSINDLKVKLTELSGVEQRTAAERVAAIEKEYELTLRKAQQADAADGGNRAVVVRKVISLESVKGEFAVVEKDYQLMLAKMQADLKAVDLNPALSTIEKQGQQDAIRAQAAGTLEAKRQELQALIQTSQQQLGLSDAEVANFNNRIRDLGQEIDGLRPKLTDLGVTGRDAFQSGFTKELAAVIGGTKSAKDAVKSLASTMIAELAKVAAQNFAKQIFGGFSGGGGGGDLIGSLFSVFGFADGGAVRGPGTGTSDSIPAMLSDGEFVNTASTVKKFGVSFFEALNRGEMPRFAMGGLVGLQRAQRFASGGLVQANAGAAASLSAPVINVSIVNTGTPQRSTGQDFDVKSGVLTVVMEDLRSNGPIAQSINGITNTRRGGAR